MSTPSSDDFIKITSVLANEVQSHKNKAFTFLWIVDSSTIAFIGAHKGKLKVNYRHKRPHEKLFRNEFSEYNQYLLAFAKLEFITEQVLNVMLTDKPTTTGYIRSGLLIQRLDFGVKIKFIKEFQEGALTGVGETLKNLQELRNTLAHNPVPVGAYEGYDLDSAKEALSAISENYTRCFNVLINLYKDHQFKLLHLAK